MRRALALSALLGLWACDDFQRLAQLKPRKVTVRLADVVHETDGGTTVAVPPTRIPPVEAWVMIDGGDWQTFQGTWVDAGLAEFALPRGFTYLARPLGTILAEVEGDDLDVSTVFYGEAYNLAGSGTSVTFDVNQAEGATASTVTSVFVPTTGQQRDNLVGIGPGVFEVSPANPMRFSYRMGWSNLPVFDRAESVFVYQAAVLDGGWVLQRRGSTRVQPIDGRDVQAPLVNLSALPDASVPFAPVEVTLNGLDDDTIAALPGGSLTHAVLELTASIDSTRATLPVAMVYSPGGKVAVPEVGVDPLPGMAWTQRVTLQLLTSSQLTLERSDGGIALDEPIPLLSTFSAAPGDFVVSATTMLSPPRDVRIGGEASGLLPTLTPVLTWSPPRNGVANRYAVTPVRFSIEPFGVEFGVTFRVANEECPIPPGMLEPGSRYFFVVDAEDCGVTTSQAPFLRIEQPRCTSASTRSLVFNTPAE